jgi:hypothetical protein
MVNPGSSFRNKDKDTLYLVVPLAAKHTFSNLSPVKHEINLADKRHSLNLDSVLVIVLDENVAVEQTEDSLRITLKGPIPNVSRSQEHFVILTREEMMALLVHPLNIVDLELKMKMAYQQSWRDKIDSEALKDGLQQLNSEISRLDDALKTKEKSIAELDTALR